MTVTFTYSHEDKNETELNEQLPMENIRQHRQAAANVDHLANVCSGFYNRP